MQNKDFQERFGIKIPEKSKFVRLEIHYVGVQLTPITKDKTHMKIVNMFDMKLKMVPTSLMNWVVKKVRKSLNQRESNSLGCFSFSG